jgi:hypothetical protein
MDNSYVQVMQMVNYGFGTGKQQKTIELSKATTESASIWLGIH